VRYLAEVLGTKLAAVMLRSAAKPVRLTREIRRKARRFFMGR
jgi:hypothetical protein